MSETAISIFAGDGLCRLEKATDLHKETFRLMVEAINLGGRLDQNSDLIDSGLTSLFDSNTQAFFNLDSEQKDQQLFENQTGLITSDTVFKSTFDGWSRLDLPQVVGRINLVTHERSIRLEPAYCSGSYSRNVLPITSDDDQRKYFAPTFYPDGRIELVRLIYDGSEQHLQMTEDDLKILKQIFKTALVHLQERELLIPKFAQENRGRGAIPDQLTNKLE
jgi:hypothetical protein